MQVRLIEDIASIGDGLVAALKSAGMTVDWVRDGLTAQQILRDTAYAIALLDIGPAWAAWPR